MPTPIRKLVKKAEVNIIRRMDHFAAQKNLTAIQLSVIDFLGHQPGFQASQREIEREFGIQRSTVTVMLQRMEKRGLITRASNPTDGRQKLVCLTKKASGLVGAVVTYIKDDDLELRRHFTTAELTATQKVLEYLIGQEE